MKKSIIICCAALFLCLPVLGAAATNEELAKENALLKQRLDRMDRELAELKEIVLGKAKAADRSKDMQAEVPPLSDEDLVKISEMVRDKDTKKGVWSNLDVQFYGFIKADASYDNSRVDNGNYVKWVDSEALNSDDNEFNLTANQTRLGFNIAGPETEGMVASGKVEFDFYGGNSSGASQNTSHPFMRHAYMKLDWPKQRFNIIAGQTWDTISPLNPFTLNYSVAWWAGNIGYRRPQIRLTKSFAVNDKVDMKLEGALARTIGRDSSFNGESGEDSGYPTFQGRASATFPLIEDKLTTVGFSGHWGREEFDTTADGKNKNFETWSLNLDVTQPVNEWLSFKGELFKGENLNQYLGGIGQGVNTTLFKEIGSKGGWIAASLGPWDKWRFNTGFTIEDVDRNDLNDGDRTMNNSIFGNAIYSFNKNTEWGVELSRWRTDYKNQGDGDDLRVQTSFVYKF